MDTISLTNGMRILFQGDSITDAGRRNADPHRLGRGYARIVASLLTALHAELGITCINRGISGDRSVDLEERWKADCLDLAPDLLSLMVGINDTGHWYGKKRPHVPADEYEARLRRLLGRTREACPGVQFVLCEPFLIPTLAERESWREDLDPKIEAVRRLSEEFGAVPVPFDRIFARALRRKPAAYWAGDGVHPTAAGHGLMAMAWLEHVLGIRVALPE